MKEYRLKVQNDLAYLFLLLALTEFFNYLVPITKDFTLILTGVMGVLLLETWFIRVFGKYSGKKISKYSDVIEKEIYIYDNSGACRIRSIHDPFLSALPQC